MIDISWKLQLRHWDIFRAASAVLDPDAGTLKGYGSSVCAGQGGAEGRAVDPLSARRGGHRQSADPHPIHADRPHSGWEFSSIIGLIKRTQRIYGRVFTVSGVIAAFRRPDAGDPGEAASGWAQGGSRSLSGLEVCWLHRTVAAVSGVCLLHAVGLAYAITILLFILSRLMPLPDIWRCIACFHRNSPACCSA